MTVLPHVLAGSGFALGGGGIFAVLAMRRRARRTDHAVVAQYEVPRDLPPVVATVLGMGKNNVESAQIVHLAVNGVIRFTEAGGTDLTAELVEPLDSADAVELDQQTQRALFGTGEAGATRTFTEHDERFGERMRALREAGLAEAVSRGLLTRRRSRTALLLSIGALVLSLATMALAIVGLSLSMRGADVALASAIVAVVASVVAIIAFSIRYRVVTPDGALSAAHLEGVSLFIRVAEADRIEMLQSYAGAERLPDGEVDIVRVYEKLLPYAMLAGHADDWGRVLERAYATHEVSPDWAPYTTMNLVTTMRSVTSSVHASAATEPSSSSYSSSGGGSTGGGFSGGGGGGGSVGGW